MYEYKAIITYVYDGDTLTADVDLGFKMWAKKIKLRLLGVDERTLHGSRSNDDQCG